jgi:hypothetical protein
VVFAGCVVIVCVITALIVRDRSDGWIRVGYVLAGMLPFLVVTVTFKWYFGLRSELFSNLSISVLWQRVTDVSRHEQILTQGAALFAPSVDWIGAALLLAFAGIRGHARSLAPAATTALVIVLTVGGYYFAYLITPHDLEWHLATSAPRLLVQLWPVVILSLVLFAADGCGGSSSAPLHNFQNLEDGEGQTHERHACTHRRQ